MIEEYQTHNPATGEVLATYATLSAFQVQSLIEDAYETQKRWAKVPVDKRIQGIKEIAKLLRDHVDEYAGLITDEMGKTLTESTAEIEKCAFLCDFYASHAKTWLSPQKIDYEDLHAERIFSPLGVVYSITPWNFPFWQVFRAAISNLLLGNTIVLKHAENVIGCSYAISSLIHQAVGEEVLKPVVIDLSLSQKIIEHPKIAAITFTGSPKVGRVIASQAGAVGKKLVLELGGSDPYIIREDIDIESVAKHITQVRMANAGQVCVSRKRLIVDSKIKQDFEKAILHYVEQIPVGHPKLQSTLMGPMAKMSLLKQLDQQIKQSIEQGAKLLAGGHALSDQSGFYYAPTVLTDVTSKMTAFVEELFGPVITIIESQDDAEAIKLANDSVYGLGSGIFSKDIKLAQKIAYEDIEAGMCFVNKCVASHPAMPFGGVKASGYGRECSIEGLHELANIKTVLVAS
ncbi:aldehyde dehydrogenase family protein [Facilibium subflavum]|uniref:aldehyde dehydrogenase family protein n=1 Tax=Facilibium subflavum TaxID=2219058 RepID=UPI0013C2A1C0|nr:aldehyde dehydrogenase family protein [Facilibium subflavum]